MLSRQHGFSLHQFIAFTYIEYKGRFDLLSIYRVSHVFRTVCLKIFGIGRNLKPMVFRQLELVVSCIQNSEINIMFALKMFIQAMGQVLMLILKK